MADTKEAKGALEARRSGRTSTDVEARAIGATVRQVIERQATELALVLPPSMDADRFARIIVSAVKSTPKLMLAFGTTQGQQSILLAGMESATIGLEPNTPAQHAWIVPRRDHGVWEGRLWLGYRGLLSLVRRSGTVKELVAAVVRENDTFAWSRQLDRDTLEHRPADAKRGKATHVYAIARLTNGGTQFIVLTREDIEARRELSDGWRDDKSRPYSPWTRFPDAMWAKSAVRSLVPWLELAPEAEHRVNRALEVDERRLVLDEDAFIIPDPEDDPDGDGEADPELDPADDAAAGDEPAEPAGEPQQS
jgi:recombination protein RecT